LFLFSRKETKHHLATIVSKVLKSIVHEAMMDHMIDHLFKNNLMSPNQHGFLPCKSCMTQLLTAVDEWTVVLDKCICMDVYKKAFNSVIHEQLLRKIHAYGFRCLIELKVF